MLSRIELATKMCSGVIARNMRCPNPFATNKWQVSLLPGGRVLLLLLRWLQTVPRLLYGSIDESIGYRMNSRPSVIGNCKLESIRLRPLPHLTIGSTSLHDRQEQNLILIIQEA